MVNSASLKLARKASFQLKLLHQMIACKIKERWLINNRKICERHAPWKWKWWWWSRLWCKNDILTDLDASEKKMIVTFLRRSAISIFCNYSLHQLSLSYRTSFLTWWYFQIRQKIEIWDMFIFYLIFFFFIAFKDTKNAQR